MAEKVEYCDECQYVFKVKNGHTKKECDNNRKSFYTERYFNDMNKFGEILAKAIDDLFNPKIPGPLTCKSEVPFKMDGKPKKKKKKK